MRSEAGSRFCCFITAIAASRSFRGYIEWALESEMAATSSAIIRPFICRRRLSAIPHIHNAQATEADFQQARHLLESWPGIVRRFADSIRWFDQAYGHTFPYLFIMEEHRHKTNCDFISDEAEWRRAKEELGSHSSRSL